MAKKKSSSVELPGPAITDEQVWELEESATAPARGQQRRIVLATCARSVETLCTLYKDSPEAFAEGFDMVEAFHAHAKGLLDIASAARARYMLAYDAAGVRHE